MQSDKARMLSELQHMAIHTYSTKLPADLMRFVERERKGTISLPAAAYGLLNALDVADGDEVRTVFKSKASRERLKRAALRLRDVLESIDGTE